MTKGNLSINFDASVSMQDFMWLLGTDFTPENAKRLIEALDWEELESEIDETITRWLKRQKNDAKIAEIIRETASEA